MINPGIYPELSNEDYHSDPAISRSGIMHFLDSPYKYWANYLSPKKPEKKNTNEMILGSALHTLVLEFKKFNEEYAIEPEKKMLKYDGETAYRLYKNECAKLEKSNKIILSREEANLLDKMKIQLILHEQAWPLIYPASYEQSYFWEDEHTGIMCKARPDILHSNMIVDLKTCRSASSRAYQHEMIDSGYHIQGAMIREGVKQCTGVDIKTVINICIEKVYPYVIGIKIISENALEHGHMKFKQALLDLKACRENNNWPSYDPEIVEFPEWAK